MGSNPCWREVDTYLLSLAGVLDTGLFVGMAAHAYFGAADGSVQKVDAKVE